MVELLCGGYSENVDENEYKPEVDYAQKGI